jgi:GrpB-like predicted nucleotidyltransferase (UPF0157 family)
MTRRVSVAPPDPQWASGFEAEAQEIQIALGAGCLAIHHVGSTSIPGIYAKPVLDLLVAVTTIDVMDERCPQMTALGYEALGEYGLPGRRFFRKDDADGVRSHHVHSYAQGSAELHRHLAFRNFMRAHPPLAQQYSDLKRRLARDHPEDMEAYMAGKDGFIQEMEQRALVWEREKERRPA